MRAKAMMDPLDSEEKMRRIGPVARVVKVQLSRELVRKLDELVSWRGEIIDRIDMLERLITDAYWAEQKARHKARCADLQHAFWALLDFQGVSRPLPSRIVDGMIDHDVTGPADLCERFTFEDVLRWKNVGNLSARELRRVLGQGGYFLKPTADSLQPTEEEPIADREASGVRRQASGREGERRDAR
jgi:hypothetical protein